MLKYIPMLIAIVASCTMYGCAATETAEHEASAGGSQGAALYNKHCSSCHGRLTRTAKPGRRAARVSSAIKNNIGGMGFLSGLSDGEISAIADELALVVPPKDASGDELYKLYCASCHGPLGKSEIAGRTLDDIKHAASREVCAAGNMKYLGASEISKLIESLGRK